MNILEFRERFQPMTALLSLILLLSPTTLDAAITDADLAEIAQLIHQGRTERAKAEITILLDDNPNDGNAAGLRKMLVTVERSEERPSPTTSVTTAKSETSASLAPEWVAAVREAVESFKRDVGYAPKRFQDLNDIPEEGPFNWHGPYLNLEDPRLSNLVHFFSEDRTDPPTFEEAQKVLLPVADLFPSDPESARIRKSLASPEAWKEELARAQKEAERTQCVNNLKQIGLAFRIWENDHDDRSIFQIAQADGGTMELRKIQEDGYDANAVAHFVALSNEVYNPAILVCPADTNRSAATDFRTLSPANISYELRTGPNVGADHPEEILARCRIHGNLLLADGSVQQLPINDASLVRVTRLIQEDKKDDARQYIHELLEANPDNPNMPKLQKILQSLGSEVAGGESDNRSVSSSSAPVAVKQTSAPTHANGPSVRASDPSPSFSETLGWIDRNKEESFDASFQDLGENEQVIRIIEISRHGDAVSFLWHERGLVKIGDVPDRYYRDTKRVQEVTIPMSALFADVKIGRNVRRTYTGEFVALHFVAKAASIKVRTWEAERISEPGVGVKFTLNGKAAAVRDLPLDKETLFGRGLMSDAQMKSWMKSLPSVDTATDKEFVYVTKDFAERMKKAFEHLIKLSGGGDKEPF